MKQQNKDQPKQNHSFPNSWEHSSGVTANRLRRIKPSSRYHVKTKRNTIKEDKNGGYDFIRISIA
jgi:hypothetical protein